VKYAVHLVHGQPVARACPGAPGKDLELFYFVKRKDRKIIAPQFAGCRQPAEEMICLWKIRIRHAAETSGFCENSKVCHPDDPDVT
jgi:hypothetical protein